MSTNREIFPIFHLPRELRDLIYVSLLQSLTTYTLPSGFKLHATHLPHPHLLLLSRQFKDEYTSLSRELSNLTIHDHCLGGSGYQLPQLPREVLGIQRVIFNVACTGFRDAAGEVEFHDRWVRGLLGQMKSDKKVGIRLHMGSGIRAGEYEASLLWSGCWTQGLEGLEELLIYRVGIGCTAWAFNAPKTLLMKWSKEKQVFEKCVEDVDGEVERGNVWLNTQARVFP